MSQYVMFADLGEKVVITDATEHPEPRPVPGAVARPGTPAPSPAAPTVPVPPSCGPGRATGAATCARTPTATTATAHPGGGPTRTTSPSASPKGPALPQHVVDMDGVPLGEPMVAVKDEAGEWSLWPAGDLDD